MASMTMPTVTKESADVEYRPAPVRPDAEIEEVDHLPKADAVDDVAERSAENHGHRGPQQP